MKTIVLSLHPEWWPKMLGGEKSLEIRKNVPTCEEWPLRVVVYLTAPVCALVGEFELRDYIKTPPDAEIAAAACLELPRLREYAGRHRVYCWRVSDPREWDRHKELAAFGLTRPPQSWCYAKGKELAG